MSTAISPNGLQWNIANSVGLGCPNTVPDVRQVQVLLNMIGMDFGGTFEFKLPENGVWSDRLERAIGDFQRKSMNPLELTQQEKEHVLRGSETMRRLNELVGRFAFCDRPGLHPFRKRLIEIARKEMGIVTDRVKGGRSDLDEYNAMFGTKHEYDNTISYRKSSARLRTYFTGTVSPEPKWDFRGKYTDQKFNTDPSDDVDYDLTIEEGIIRWNKRPPLGSTKTKYSGSDLGYYNGFHWCGVFAVWALKQAGMKTVWWDTKLRGIAPALKVVDYTGGQPMGNLVYTEINSPKVQEQVAWEQIPLLPGDVVIIQGGNNHHLIVTEVSITGRMGLQGTFKAVAGNSNYQEVAEESHALNKIYRIYHTWSS